jgi:hypothetical protein
MAVMTVQLKLMVGTIWMEFQTVGLLANQKPKDFLKAVSSVGQTALRMAGCLASLRGSYLVDPMADSMAGPMAFQRVRCSVAPTVATKAGQMDPGLVEKMADQMDSRKAVTMVAPKVEWRAANSAVMKAGSMAE